VQLRRRNDPREQIQPNPSPKLSHHTSPFPPLPQYPPSPSPKQKAYLLFVIGTVKLSSAFPINRKNHTLPVALIKKGIAYAGRRKVSMTAKKARRMSLETGLRLGRERMGWYVGRAVRAAPVWVGG